MSSWEYTIEAVRWHIEWKAYAWMRLTFRRTAERGLFKDVLIRAETLARPL